MVDETVIGKIHLGNANVTAAQDVGKGIAIAIFDFQNQQLEIGGVHSAILVEVPAVQDEHGIRGLIVRWIGILPQANNGGAVFEQPTCSSFGPKSNRVVPALARGKDLNRAAEVSPG